MDQESCKSNNQNSACDGNCESCQHCESLILLKVGKFTTVVFEGELSIINQYIGRFMIENDIYRENPSSFKKITPGNTEAIVKSVLVRN